jgi:hypothetical protein
MLFGAQRTRETAKPLQILKLMKATFDCGGNTRQRSVGEASRKKFTGPKKGRFPEIDDAVFTFFQERCKTGLFVNYDVLCEEAIKKARFLNILRSRFRASKGWAIRFMRRMGLALRCRTTICQKLPKDFDQKLLNYKRYITKLRKAGQFLMGQMANADETAIYFDMLPNYTLEKKGVKEVLLKTTGCERLRWRHV